MVVKYMTNRKILAWFEYTSNFLFKSVMFKHLFESFTSFVDNELGLINSCQFLWIIFPPFLLLGFDPKFPSMPEVYFNKRSKFSF